MREQSKRSQNKIQPRKVQCSLQTALGRCKAPESELRRHKQSEHFKGFYQCHPFRAFLESFKPQNTLSTRPLYIGVWMNSLRQPAQAVGGSKWVHIGSIFFTFVCPRNVTFAYVKSLNKEKADRGNILPCWGLWLQGRGWTWHSEPCPCFLFRGLSQVTVAELRACCPA